MNTEFLKDNWQNLGVKIGGGTFPLKHKYVLCLGYHPDHKHVLLFDRGGEQPGEVNLLSVGAGNSLISHDPTTPGAAIELGELVSLAKPQALIGGRYKHFKGTVYKILHVARHSEAEQDLVIYQDVENPSKIWARPYDMFFDHVSKHDYRGPRFTLLDF